MTGQPTGGKPINLSQLEAELVAAGVSADGLGMDEDVAYVYPYDAGGEPVDFTAVDQPKVDQTISNHVAMRDKTSAEYAAEFQDSNTTPARKQEIRDIQNGLMPPEQMPITQEEWDKQMNPAGVA